MATQRTNASPSSGESAEQREFPSLEESGSATSGHTTATDTGAKQKHHYYHGHRRKSFTTTDVDELTELRARQRTFEGAYQRTALGMAVYAIIVLKVFSSAFAKIGILYVVMAGVMIIISLIRKRRSMHDFADEHRQRAEQTIATQEGGKPSKKRVWGREFRTVGNLVIFLTLAVGGLELAIFVLLMRL